MSRPKKNKGLFGASKSGQASGSTKAQNGKSQNGGEKGRERKTGFKVGPAHAAKNAYLGKAKKIKADLIMKSKLKKEYAKVLKETGGQSERLERKPRPTTQSTSPAEEQDRDTEHKSTYKGKVEKRKSFERNDKPDHSLKRSKSTSSGKSGKSGKDHKIRALSPSDVGPPMPQSSFLELKKEAFKKYHPPPQTSKTGGFGMGKPRGQPNMGARMNVLLEKIKRDKA